MNFLKTTSFYVFLISFVCFEFSLAMAQTSNISRKIKWLQSENANDKFVFPEAVYNNPANLIPTYFESIELKNFDANIKVSLKNEVFETIEIENTELNLNDISNEISISYNVYSQRKQLFLQLSILPFRKNKSNGLYQKLVSFDIVITTSNKTANASPVFKRNHASRSVLGSGNWYKIRIETDGIYRITYSQLRDLGFSNPAQVRLFGNATGELPDSNSIERPDDLVENNIVHENDAIIFYGQGPVTWKFSDYDTMFVHNIHHYSKAAYYFLTDYNTGNSNNLPLSESNLSANKTIQTFDDRYFHEIDSVNEIKSGRNWYGEHFKNETLYSFAHSLPNIVAGSEVKMKISLLAVYANSSYFSISAPNLSKTVNIAYTPANYYDDFALVKTNKYKFSAVNNSDFPIEIKYNKMESDAEGWLDYYILNLKRQLSMHNGQLFFRSLESVGTQAISKFYVANASSNLKVWDITNPTEAIKMNGTLTGNVFEFSSRTENLREFIAFDGTRYLTPGFSGDDVGVVENQNLHGSPQVKMVIVTAPEFFGYAEEIANIHRELDGMSVLVVEQEKIFNEFSSGAPDITALRDFMKMFYDRAGSEAEMPSYLLLFGDGSYDNKRQFEGNTNFLLTYQSVNSVDPSNSYVSDDYFGLLDDDEGYNSEGLLDLGIGRFPVKTAAEAETIIAKIKRYLSEDAFGDWRNLICFIADDAEIKHGTMYEEYHMRHADQLATYIDTTYQNFNFEKIYLDAYQQISTAQGTRYPSVNTAVTNRIKKGALIMNYTGHGGELQLADEGIVTFSDIFGWDNRIFMPIFITATCEFSRFDDYNRTSAGEYIFLNPNGGAIAMFTTTRLVYSSPNYTLNYNFYKNAFGCFPTGEAYRLGDIVRLTKRQSSQTVNKLNFTLFGDPALPFVYPKNIVVTDSINQNAVQYGQTDYFIQGTDTLLMPAKDGYPISAVDTLKALSKVSIAGHVENSAGQFVENFVGELTISVYDKAVMVSTLGNDGNQPLIYKEQNNILYKGKASIKNGRFRLEFIVPKDISYNFDFGRISYYASNKIIDGAGFYENIIIGGTNPNPIADNGGPEIKLYMNDENFTYGSTTNENPKILAFINDESGINTVGNGIGHDLTATLDDNSEKHILNDYYEAEIDSYQSGKIEYPLEKLETGDHKITLKVWDVYNNSSEEEIEFTVVNSENISLNRIFNYPNPFSTNTDFYFEHNQPNSDLDVLIQIYTVSNKLVKTIEAQINTAGFLSTPINWNGLDDYGDKLGRGVYVYRVKIRNSYGKTVEKYEKLLLLR